MPAPKAPQETKVSTPLTISLPESTYNAVIASIPVGTAADKGLTSRCEWFLRMYAAGGFMMQPSDLQRLKNEIGMEATLPAQIVKALLAKGGKKEGQHVFEITIDPIYIEPLEAIAKEQGWSMDDLITDAIDTIMSNGWLYEISPKAAPFFVSPTERAELDEIMGKQVYRGGEVLAKIREIMAVAKKATTPAIVAKPAAVAPVEPAAPSSELPAKQPDETTATADEKKDAA